MPKWRSRNRSPSLSRHFRARPARGSLSLACARESDQREHTPDAALPAAVREVRPGFVERPSLCVQRTRAHRARDLSGISVLPSPRQTGTRRSTARSKATACDAFAFPLPCFCAQERAASALPGPHCIAAAAVGKARRVRAMDRAHSAIAHGRAISGTRPLMRTRRAGCASGAMLWGAFLCLLSLCKQRK